MKNKVKKLRETRFASYLRKQNKPRFDIPRYDVKTGLLPSENYFIKVIPPQRCGGTKGSYENL